MAVDGGEYGSNVNTFWRECHCTIRFICYRVHVIRNKDVGWAQELVTITLQCKSFVLQRNRFRPLMQMLV